MRYKPQQYAESLYESLIDKEGDVRQVIIQNFLRILRKNGDMRGLNLVLRNYEKLYLKKNNLVKVHLETPEIATDDLKKSIKNTLGKEILFDEKVNPGLLAGLKLLLNDSILIDASGKTRLERLFNT